MHQRKSKKILIYFFVLILLGSINSLNLPDFDLNKKNFIKVSGLNETEKLSFIEEIQNLNLGSIFFINKNKFNEIIFKNSLVESYKISKIYPFTLVVTVNKTNFLAKINKEGKILIIGSNGKFIEDNYNNKDLPFIFGKPKIQEFLDFKKIIDDSKFSYEEVKNFYFFPSKRWDLELKNNIVLKLPKKNSKNSLDYLFEFIADKNLKNNLIIDARIRNQIIYND